MKIFEIENNITFTTEFIAKPTRKDTASILKLHARSGSFEKWWWDPEVYLTKGAIFSIAWDGNKAIGIGLINFDIEDEFKHKKRYLRTKKYTYRIIGIIGFFIDSKYRGMSLAATLAKKLENKLLSTFPEFNKPDVIPMVLTFANANVIISKVFKKVKSIDNFEIWNQKLQYDAVKRGTKRSYSTKYDPDSQQSGRRKANMNEKVQWATEPEQAWRSGKNDLQDPNYKLMWLNIKDIFGATEKFQRLDPTSRTGGPNTIGDRIKMAKQHWADGNYMNLSIIGWNDYTNAFNFTDGRHRLVAAYQMGERWAPVLVDKNSVNKVEELIGFRS